MQTSVFDAKPQNITRNGVVLFLYALVIFLVLGYFWGEYMLTDFNELKGSGEVSVDGLKAVWPLFAWATFGTAGLFWLSSSFPYIDNPLVAMLKGWWLSINAGVFEELVYRWLVFCSAMVLLTFFDFITFGFAQWVYTELLLPLANAATLEKLEPQLMSANWVFGAAIVSACAAFRSQHQYLGLIGWVNSWFLGMVFFYLTFNFGLLTAITAHILYDAICFSLTAWLSYFRSQQ